MWPRCNIKSIVPTGDETTCTFPLSVFNLIASPPKHKPIDIAFDSLFSDLTKVLGDHNTHSPKIRLK